MSAILSLVSGGKIWGIPFFYSDLLILNLPNIMQYYTLCLIIKDPAQ